MSPSTNSVNSISSNTVQQYLDPIVNELERFESLPLHVIRLYLSNTVPAIQKEIAATDSCLLTFLKSHPDLFEVNDLFEVSYSKSAKEVTMNRFPDPIGAIPPSKIKNGRGFVARVFPTYGFIQCTHPFKTGVYFSSRITNNSYELSPFEPSAFIHGQTVGFDADFGNGTNNPYRATKVWNVVSEDHDDEEEDDRYSCDSHVSKSSNRSQNAARGKNKNSKSNNEYYKGKQPFKNSATFEDKVFYSKGASQGESRSHYPKDVSQGQSRSQYSKDVSQGQSRPQYSKDVSQGQSRSQYSKDISQGQSRSQYSKDPSQGQSQSECSKDISQGPQSQYSKEVSQGHSKHEKPGPNLCMSSSKKSAKSTSLNGEGFINNVFLNYGFITSKKNKADKVFFALRDVNVTDIYDLRKILNCGDAVDFTAVPSFKKTDSSVLWQATSVTIKNSNELIRTGDRPAYGDSSEEEPIPIREKKDGDKKKITNSLKISHLEIERNSDSIQNQQGKIYPQSDTSAIIRFGPCYHEAAEAEVCPFYLGGMQVNDIKWEFQDGDFIFYKTISIAV